MSDTDLLNSTENGSNTDANRTEGKWRGYLNLITVEPSMFFYMLAFMTTSVAENAFFVYKACSVDLGYSDDICDDLPNYKNINEKVQVLVSDFFMWNDIASQVLPMCLALFIGAWSDRRGRKILLLMGLLGKLWYSIWIVINATQKTWPLNTVIYSASLPSGLTGADVAIFAASFSYICDVTTEESRTLRVTVLDITYLVSIPVGVAFGNYLYYNVVDKSFAVMFGVNAAFLCIAFIYSLVRLEWLTSPKQRKLPLCCSKTDDDNASCILDFFDMDHLIKSLQTILKSRPFYGRLFVWILILSLALYTFQRDERQMSYLYTQLEFKWDFNDFSNFRTFQSAFYVVGTTLCLPLMTKWMKLSDTTIIMIGTVAHAAARVLYVFAQVPWLFYLGSAISSLGPVVAPVIRAAASKIVPLHERGKLFAVLSVADTAVPLFSGIVYSQVYNATIKDYPSAIFWVTVATQMTVFLFALLMKILLRGHSMEECIASPDGGS